MNTREIASELGLTNGDLALAIYRMIIEEKRYIKHTEKQISILHVSHNEGAQWYFFSQEDFVAKQTEQQIRQFLDEEQQDFFSHCTELI